MTNWNRPQITEAAVVGAPSETWGQKVVAIVVLNQEVAAKTGRDGKPWNAWDMRLALKDRLAPYKIPVEMKVIDREIPRNAMGKGEFSVWLIDLIQFDPFSR